MRTLVWFRGKDLRLADHAPLSDACARGEVIPLFVLDPYWFAPERAAKIPHRMQFLLASLRSLQANVRARGSDLVIAEGKSVDVVPMLAERFKVDRVVAQRWTDPLGRERDRRVEAALRVPFVLFDGETLLTPGSLRTKSGTTFSVYTPFARAFRAAIEVARPLPAPKSLPPLPVSFDSAAIPSFPENPRVQPGGEKNARDRLKRFIEGPALDYDAGRDRMGEDGTSRLSADLKFGTLSPRTAWHASLSLGPSRDAEKFRSELLWREFTHDLIWHRPQLLREPFREEFRRFPWRNDEGTFRAWAEGRTGYPVVDAAARELLATGYVHNRARMIAASFLTKHLLIDYRLGEAHYLRWLTDGDPAQNNAGWQWSAGCGVDAQPWFRVFNPTLQAQRFDPNGAYVHKWLGDERTPPIVDHKAARARFLAAAKTMK